MIGTRPASRKMLENLNKENKNYKKCWREIDRGEGGEFRLINVHDFGLVTTSRKSRKKIRRHKEDNNVENVRPVRNSDKNSENLKNLTVRTSRRKNDSYSSGPEALGLKEKLKIFEENSRIEIGKEEARNSEEEPSKESTRKKILKFEEEERKWKEKREENYRKREEERKYSKMEKNPWNGIEMNDMERKRLGISPRGKIGKHLKTKLENEKIKERKKQLLEASSPLFNQVRPVPSKFNLYAVQEKGLGHGLRTEMRRTPGLATTPELAGNGPTRRTLRKWDGQDRN